MLRLQHSLWHFLEILYKCGEVIVASGFSVRPNVVAAGYRYAVCKMAEAVVAFGISFTLRP